MLDSTLIPVVAQLKKQLETHKTKLEAFFPKRVIERACYDYVQQNLSNNPRIMMPTLEAVAFYRNFTNPRRLKEIIFEQEKLRFTKELPILVGEDTTKAKKLLTKFRLARLKRYQPGLFSEYLNHNGCFTQHKPVAPKTSKKTVRFA